MWSNQYMQPKKSVDEEQRTDGIFGVPKNSPFTRPTAEMNINTRESPKTPPKIAKYGFLHGWIDYKNYSIRIQFLHIDFIFGQCSSGEEHWPNNC